MSDANPEPPSDEDTLSLIIRRIDQSGEGSGSKLLSQGKAQFLLTEGFRVDSTQVSPPANTSAEFGEAVGDSPEPAGPDNNGPLETLVDESALHEMVSRLLEQELRGPAGDMIERKVRNLVRREIRRLLADSDLF